MSGCQNRNTAPSVPLVSYYISKQVHFYKTLMPTDTAGIQAVVDLVNLHTAEIMASLSWPYLGASESGWFFTPGTPTSCESGYLYDLDAHPVFVLSNGIYGSGYGLPYGGPYGYSSGSVFSNPSDYIPIRIDFLVAWFLYFKHARFHVENTPAPSIIPSSATWMQSGSSWSLAAAYAATQPGGIITPPPFNPPDISLGAVSIITAPDDVDGPAPVNTKCIQLPNIPTPVPGILNVKYLTTNNYRISEGFYVSIT